MPAHVESGFFAFKTESRFSPMNKKLHVISTGQQPLAKFVSIAALIHEDVDAFHLRETSWSARELVNAIDFLSVKGVPLEKIIVNDRIDVAHSMKVRGVQLSHHSLRVSTVKKAFPTLQIGCSIHTLDGAIEAAEMGADYLLYGHVFPTSSKQGITPKGLDGLKEITEQVTIPVIAIGGITPENARDALTMGVEGIAVLSGILLATDPLKAVKDYKEKMEADTCYQMEQNT